MNRVFVNKCLQCPKQSELISLRASVKRFEDGRQYKKLSDELDKAQRKLEKSEKERHELITENHILRTENRQLIRSLSIAEQDYDTLLNLYENTRDLLNEADIFQSEDFFLIMENVVAELNDTVLSVMKENEDLKGQNAKLRAQITKDNTNSSIPSSQCPNHKTPNNREKTGRKAGAQKGHKGHRRKHLEPTEEIHRLAPPHIVVNNPDYYKTDQKIVKQLIRISLQLEVIQYEADVYRHHKSRKKVHAAFPEGMVNDVEYDASVCAFISLLHSHGNMSYDKIIEVISELTDGKLTPSKGMIADLEKKFSKRSEEDRKQIFNRMLVYPYMHIDGTTVRVNGKNGQVLIETSPVGTLLYHTGIKGDKAVMGTAAEEYDGISIHDGESTFFHYGKEHQCCLVHELRYLKGSMDNEPHLTWASLMREYLQFLMHYINTAKEDGRKELTDQDKIVFEEQYDQILDLAEREYTEHPPNLKYYNDGYKTMKRLRKRKEQYLLFLSDLSIPCQNNPAELVARKVKMHSKQSGGYRSPIYSQYHCDVLSVMESNKALGIGRYTTLLDVYKRR